MIVVSIIMFGVGNQQNHTLFGCSLVVYNSNIPSYQSLVYQSLVYQSRNRV